MYGQLPPLAAGSAVGTHLRRSAPCRNRSTADAARIFYGLAQNSQGQFFPPTNVRGRVLIYASKTRYSRTEEASLTEELGLDVAALPRGVIVGRVDIVGVEKLGEGDYAWLLARPKRARKFVAPTRQPLPTFFKPF